MRGNVEEISHCVVSKRCHGNRTAITVITWVSGCSGNETWRVCQYVFSTARLLSVLAHSDPISTDLKCYLSENRKLHKRKRKLCK